MNSLPVGVPSDSLSFGPVTEWDSEGFALAEWERELPYDEDYELGCLDLVEAPEFVPSPADVAWLGTQPEAPLPTLPRICGGGPEPDDDPFDASYDAWCEFLDRLDALERIARESFESDDLPVGAWGGHDLD